MPDTAVVWFRRDLRVHDLPALAHACREHERVVPLFVFDPSAARRALPLARSHGVAARVPARRSTASCGRGERAWWCAAVARRPRFARVAPRGRRPRRARVRRRDRLRALARRPRGGGAGARRRRAASPPRPLRRRPAARSTTRQGGPYKVFTPFLRAWRAQERRAPERAPRAIAMPRGRRGRAAVAARAGLRRARAAARGPPGAGRGRRPPRRGALAARRAPRALRRAPRRPGRADLAPVGLPALRLPLAAVARARGGRPPSAALPRPARLARLPRRRAAALPRTPPASSSTRATARWSGTPTPRSCAPGARAATGFPVVDAAMRQLAATGWMHNRARHDRRLVPDQGPPAGLARGRAPLHGPSARRRRRLQQRRLAVDRLDGHRPRARTSGASSIR